MGKDKGIFRGGKNMATLTYNVFTGHLEVISDDGKTRVFAECESGFSNFPSEARQRERGKFGTSSHVRGGPIPAGRWKVHRPGARHPDGGQLRPHWIPIGPVSGRTLIYLHPFGHRTEGCIAIKQVFERVRDIVAKDGGGVLHVIGADVDLA